MATLAVEMPVKVFTSSQALAVKMARKASRHTHKPKSIYSAMDKLERSI